MLVRRRTASSTTLCITAGTRFFITPPPLAARHRRYMCVSPVASSFSHSLQFSGSARTSETRFGANIIIAAIAVKYRLSTSLAVANRSASASI